MRIALIGAGGQLAADLITALADYEVAPFLRSDLDLTQPESIASALVDRPWDAIVNTAAYNLVDRAETEPLAAYETNAAGVGNLARYCGTRGLRLVHFSTDYVFGLSDTAGRPWTEEDAAGPVSVYGNSKLAGEFAVRMYAPNHLILRTCGLYGIKGSRGKGGNFVETMLKLAAAGKPLRIVGDQTCTPSFTVDVADAARRLLATDARGIVHVTNAGSCTWFEFASTIFENAGLNVPVERITSVEFAAPARRPSFSALALDKYQSLTHHELPAWPQALDRYLALRG